MEKLGETREKFQLQIENQFQLLYDEHKEIDAKLYEWNEQIVEAIYKTASKIAGKTHSNKISDSTRKLMEKRRQLKMDSTVSKMWNTQKHVKQSGKS